MKNLWNKYTDILGKTILHPQFIINSLVFETVQKAQKLAKGDLIDLGCGRQPYRSLFIDKVKSYTAVDHPQVSKLYPSHQKPDILADIHSLPFRDHSYDTAVMFEVLEYLENPGLALSEINRVLKSNGTLIFSTPFMYGIHDAPHDRYRLTQTALSETLKNTGFKVIKTTPLGNFWQFWFQSLSVYIFKSCQRMLSSKSLFTKIIGIFTLAFSPIVFVPLNILSAISRNLFKEENKLYPLTIQVIAKKK